MRKPKLLLFDPWELMESPNARRDLPESDVRQMAQDLVSAGCQLQPVGVRRDEEGFWRLVYGHRRLAGLRWLARHGCLPPDSPLRAVQAVEVSSAEDELLLQIRENSARRNLRVSEEVELIGRLEAQGLDTESIAGVFGRSPAWVSQRRALRRLPQDVLEQVGRTISPYDAYKMAVGGSDSAVPGQPEQAGPRAAPRRPAARQRPSSRDAVRLLRRLARQGCRAEILDALMMYLDGRIPAADAEDAISRLLEA